MATHDKGSMYERRRYLAEQGWPKLLRLLNPEDIQGFPMQKYEWATFDIAAIILFVCGTFVVVAAVLAPT